MPFIAGASAWFTSRVHGPRWGTLGRTEAVVRLTTWTPRRVTSTASGGLASTYSKPIEADSLFSNSWTVGLSSTSE